MTKCLKVSPWGHPSSSWRKGQERSGKVRKGQERSGKVRKGQDRSGMVMKGHERSGMVREGHGRSYPNTRCVNNVRKVTGGWVGGL